MQRHIHRNQDIDVTLIQSKQVLIHCKDRLLPAVEQNPNHPKIGIGPSVNVDHGRDNEPV